MENTKAYLFVESPFSFKNRRTLLFFVAYVATAIGLVFATCFLYASGDLETAKMFFVIAPVWICVETFAALFLLCSHITVDDGILVCKYAGFIPRRIPKGSVDRVHREQGNLVLYSKGQQVLSVLDCSEARKLLELAHIQSAQ